MHMHASFILIFHRKATSLLVDALQLTKVYWNYIHVVAVGVLPVLNYGI